MGAKCLVCDKSLHFWSLYYTKFRNNIYLCKDCKEKYQVFDNCNWEDVRSYIENLSPSAAKELITDPEQLNKVKNEINKNNNESSKFKVNSTIAVQSNAIKTNTGDYIKQLQKLYKSYGYVNIPEVENETSAKWVLEHTNRMFGAVLVPKEYMENITKNGHEYVTGDIVLLWWLTSRKNISNKPLYFYRTYGINPEKSINKLINTGLLTKDMDLTAAGRRVVNNSKMIIKHHRALKSWSGVGPVKYTYKKTVKTKIPEKYSNLPKKQQYPWSSFDIGLKDAKSEHCKYIQWKTVMNPCKECMKIGAQDNGKGSGIYSIKDAPKLRDTIHPGCTCRIFPYKLSDKFLPPITSFSTRDPKTGKSINVKARQY